jgi:HPt (histidine-containing phosphotransfer) domain-containing protein
MRDMRNLDGHASKINQQAIDLDWLLERCNSDSELMFEVLRLFSDQCKPHLNEMRSASEEQKWPEAAFHAEFIIGSAANVGASDLRMQAELLYHLFPQQIADAQSSSIPRLLAKITSSFRRCLSCIAAIKIDMRKAAEPQRRMLTCKSRSFRVQRSSPERALRRPLGLCRRGSTDSIFLDVNKGDPRLESPIPPPGDSDGAVLTRMRGHLDDIRQHNQAGRGPAARAEAFALYFTASGAGCWGLAAAAARAGMGGRYIAKQAMDELEARLDTEAALWELKRSCRPPFAANEIFD